MNLDSSIAGKVQYWSTADAIDSKTRSEVKALVDAADEKELTERFYRDLEFGTGGLRGILGAGTARMNVYNIRKAATALASYLLEVASNDSGLVNSPASSAAPSDAIKVAISFDSRRYSKEFAHAAAEVLAAYDIKTYITKELRPVPMLSFMVRHFRCQAGICVTASHNPPEYNGFKVYWRTGGQLVPPHDRNIIERYQAIDSYDDLKTIPFDAALEAGSIEEVGSDFDEAYFAETARWNLNSDGRKDFKIVYTPLHGAGLYPVTEMLSRFGFDQVEVVEAQRQPDGSFPTVSSPNPEDPAALELAVEAANKSSADLVMATDPDGDRIGMLVRDGDTYFRPNGNQIGCLLNEYVLSALKGQGRLPEDPLTVKTIVTTDLQADLAREYGATCEETLTGFKWIAALIEDYESGAKKPYKRFVCGGEESFGFLAGSAVRDKDAVVACALAAEMVAVYKAQGLSIKDVLNNQFTRHGIYEESLHNLTLPGKSGAEKIVAMMDRLRADPPRVIDQIPVARLRDFKTLTEQSLKDGVFEKASDLTLPTSNVLQFILTDGTKVSVRPSGTEPKIKFYVSVKEPKGKGQSGADLERLKLQCAERVKRIEQFFVRLAC